MSAKKIYYAVKPLIPRRLQIELRRLLVRRQLRLCKDIWPVDQKASQQPREWSGWPDGKRFAVVLTHDVDTAQGHDQCWELMKLEHGMGFRSSFNFVTERYLVSADLRQLLTQNGFEVGVHGLYHDHKYYESREIFEERAIKINHYLESWQAVGFRTPAMFHNLEWIGELNIEYDASTFDTDPFEPQPDGVGTIFPFLVTRQNGQDKYVELPYTLPQDFTLFILMKEQNISVWKRKLDWIANHGGMALVITHPDYMNFTMQQCKIDKYPADIYRDFLEYVRSEYKGQYWHALPKEIAQFWKERYAI